MLDLIRE